MNENHDSITERPAAARLAHMTTTPPEVVAAIQNHPSTMTEYVKQLIQDRTDKEPTE